ncbi:MAG: putative histidine kinase, hybrid [Myxococcaceae bacterium]|nr:putative histidine kinase, hybrid [Myxococcaceae bacterium]
MIWLRVVTTHPLQTATLLDDSAAFVDFVDSMREPAWLLREDTSAAYLGPAFREYTGLSEPEDERPAWLRVIHPELRLETEAALRAGLSAAMPFRLSTRVRDHAGEHHTFSLSLVPLRAPGLWLATLTPAEPIVQGVHDAPEPGREVAGPREERRTGSAKLSVSEASYRALANAMPQIVWTSHPDGGLDWINERWREYTGAEADGEAIRRSYVHPDDVESIVASWDAALAAPAVCEFEYRLRRKDGVYRWHLGRVVPFLQDGKLVRWIATATDIDDRKRAEEARRSSEERARLQAEELATLMDAVPAAVVIGYDRECRELRGNRVASEMFRTPLGANLSKTAHDPEATAHMRIMRDGQEIAPDELPVQRAARLGIELRDIEVDLQFPDGACMSILCSAVPLRDASGQARGAIGAFVDVTRLKLAEEALRAADRRKDEFLAVLSHELRNPLAPITTAVELMKLRNGVASEHEIAVIERQARHMVRLVDDLLDISRVARGKVELRRERIELSRVVARAVEVTGVLIEQRHHQLSVEVPQAGLEVDGDEVRLTQVVVNLLTNAARYTKTGGHIQVTATREGERVVLRVRDDGMGIAPELLPHVFEMFVQGARGPDRAEGGLGLGLALVASLTALHGGSVHAASAGPGLGSTFELRLPWLSPCAPTAQEAPLLEASRQAPPKRTILVVDDNEDAADMLSLVLQRAGFEVRVAADPPAALSLVQSWCPEIAILDIGLPVMDGHQLARELRRLLGDRVPTLIALSGYGQAQDHEQSRESGFAHHLTKPVARTKLLAVLAGESE